MKAWLYYRLSRDEDQEMNSLQNQRQILVDYAEQNGHEIVGESFDDNVSGMTFNRKGLGELEDAVDEGIVEVVLVKDLSRLGRHRTQTELFIDHLRQNKVKVISVTENIDTDNENDDLLIGFKQIFNDFYAKDISRKVRAGLRQKQKLGLVVHLPMGYFKDKNTGEVKVDENAAEIIQSIFQMYINGRGLTTIAKILNEKEIRSPEYFSHRKIGAQRTDMCKRFLWTQTTVKRIIQNESYTGTLVNHKTITSKIHKTVAVIPQENQYRHDEFLPVIIDRQVWQQAQILMKSRLKTSARANADKVFHRYSGMIKCAECNASLIAKNRSWNGVPYVEYSCNSYNRYGKKYCTPHRIHEKQIDELIISELCEWRDKILEQSKKYDKIVSDWLKKKPRYERQIKRYSEQITAMKGEIEDLIIERIHDRERTEYYNNMIAKREEMIGEYEQKIKEYKQYDEVCKDRKDKFKGTAELINNIIDDGVINDAQLRMLVSRIVVHQKDDCSLDVRLELSGDFDMSVSTYLED